MQIIVRRFTMTIFHQFYGCIKQYYHHCTQTTWSSIMSAKTVRNNVDCFQKVGQIAGATLILLMKKFSALSSLSRFSFTLQTVNMHDFYAMILRPYQWLCPVSADAINEDKVYNDLHQLIMSDPKMKLNPEALEKKLKGSLVKILKDMSDLNQAYRNVEAFASVVIQDLKKDKDFSGIDFSGIKQKKLSNWIRPTSLGEKITNFNWLLVDIGCVSLYLKDWNLFNTGKLANRLGQFSVLKWVKNHHLESWVTGLVSTAFIWKFFESLRKLNDDKLTAQDKKRESWNAVASFGEVILFGTSYLNLIGKIKIDNSYLQWLTIVAKSIGLISLLVKPGRQYFQVEQKG